MTTEPVREIPQRELRNNISKILEKVARGERYRITVRGKPVADLVPVTQRRRFVPKEVFLRIIEEHPLDPSFKEDVDSALDNTIRER